MNNGFKLTRRQFLVGTSATMATSLVTPSIAKAQTPVKALSLYNTHTGEFFKEAYCEHGCYIKESIAKINHIMRDWRTNEITQMDVKLIDLLHHLHQKIGNNKPFEIISAYRCPRTNSMLREAGNHVAKNSFHLKGQAIDIQMSGFNLQYLRDAAYQTNAKGVGYYPSSGFIHVDVGHRAHKKNLQARW
ncbi:YcbK family protein [Candidatus Nucleicultrix amoebiphila]|jgi:uncharacterized protein YcbK (DUF882 family)|uniref:Murein endopeptidase K n=1 Tax=Candidatus Nucleicultrix amoebiphila FS5 TaxID=1414854 RepID=A0A1W6N3S1_9PROT|nr:DUF882 domain-containing protein [Candidatus Nucleicultrix amoebiphila]ARN84530.1 hypothetical protein GQ61_03430 [Candidatus Nucleicultrix amoebiphila FS5]